MLYEKREGGALHLADPGTPVSEARGFTHEIRVNGRLLLVGDDLSVLVVANNLSGANMDDENQHSLYCRFLGDHFLDDADAVNLGAQLEIAKTGGPALIKTTVGSKIRMRSNLLDPG